jgi:hypothetical protein
MRIDLQIVQHQIANLQTTYPDLTADEEGWMLALSGETELDELLTMLVTKIGDTDALLDGTAIRAEELAARQARFKRRIEAYRALIFKLMEAAELPKRELPLATISVRKGTPKVIITDEAALPDTVCKFTRKPDLALIKDILTNSPSPPLPGATLSNAEPSITIRVK